MGIFKTQISEDEIEFLTGGDDPYDDQVDLNKFFHPNLKLLIVTEGSNGCRYYTQVIFIPSKTKISGHYNAFLRAQGVVTPINTKIPSRQRHIILTPNNITPKNPG